jgi:hypothetical protein
VVEMKAFHGSCGLKSVPFCLFPRQFVLDNTRSAIGSSQPEVNFCQQYINTNNKKKSIQSILDHVGFEVLTAIH